MEKDHTSLTFAYLVLPESQRPLLEDIPPGISIKEGQHSTQSYATDAGMITIEGVLYEFFGSPTALLRLQALFQSQGVEGFNF